MDEQEDALRARAEARVGSTLRDKYRLDRVIGIGGMAAVFAATHRNQAELAVKVLHSELSLRDNLKKRFLREGYVANSVKHPGAVLVVDDDIAEDGSAFLVMELLRGATLEDLWERAGRRLSSRAVTALALQLLEVLASAHEKAIVHRDLKPANLFLTTDGSVKVLDFGIARLRDAMTTGEHATRTGTLMGTPAFMAPEQAQAVADEIDGQTDLWAVGATMFTLLSSQLVHDGDNSSQLLIKAGTSRARPLESAVPGVEPAIAAVVDKALCFEKAGRWTSAAAMRDALLTAASKAFGKPPGRDALLDLLVVEPSTRRMGNAETERAPGTPRLVVDGGAENHGPTFATPSSRDRPSGAAAARTPAGRTAVSGVQPPLQGLTTGNPVSREAETVRTAHRQVPLASIVTAVAVVTALVAVVFAFARPKADGAVAAATAAPSHESAPASAGPAPPPPAALPDPAPATASPPAATVSPAAPSAAPKPAEPSTPAAHERPAAQPKTDCSTPYTFDSDGNKKWKLECLPH